MTQRWMTDRRVVIVLLFLLTAGCIGAMEIYIAPILYQDEEASGSAEMKRPAADMLKRLSEAPIADGVNLHEATVSTDSSPRSFLEAARLCESEGYPYLLYGFVKHTGYSYYAELKLMERQRKELAVAFVAADDMSHYERLMDDLTAKLVSYVRTDLGMGPPRLQDQPARNIIVLPMSVGYWTPMGRAWSQAMAGLATADVSLRFIPSKPMFLLWGRPCFLALGLDFEYALGLNQPGVETFYLHVAKARMPVETFMDVSGGHRLGLGAGPLLEVDTMAKAQQYGSTVVETTVVPGVSFSLQYHYAISSSVSVGLTNNFDIALYSQALFTYSPKIAVQIWLAQPGQTGENHGTGR